VTPLPCLVLLAAQPAPAPLPPDLAPVWAAFQAALQKGDAAGVAKVCRFPLRSNDLGGPVPDAAALQRRFARIFPPDTRVCLLKATLQKAEGARDTYEAFCDVEGLPIRFLFTKTKAGWRLTTLDNINE
jgi:hypothetical protein